jgi:lysozyme family protein
MKEVALSAFDQAFAIVVGHEAGFTDNRADSGNWTGGTVGKGELKGTKYGISAASYPQLDIRNLTLDAAKAIYRRDYWDAMSCDEWAPGLALIVFDAAVNNGVGLATRLLQTAVGVPVDGIIGPVTRGAVLAADAAATATELHAQRIFFMAGLTAWRTFGLGWSRRLARLPAQAAGMTA